jgi:RNA polymerase sigma-70 factor, ECF subfamily
MCWSKTGRFERGDGSRCSLKRLFETSRPLIFYGGDGFLFLLRLCYQMMLLQRRVLGPATTQMTTLTPTMLQTQYGNVILRYLTARLPHLADAEDVTVDVFVAAFSAIARCPAQSREEDFDPVRAWLLAIARNKCIDHLRKHKNQQTATLEEYQDIATPSAENVALQHERQYEIRAVIATLPTDQREVLLLKYVDGLSLKEIGLILHKRPEAVSSLLQRARASAREKGQEYFGN